MGQDIRPNQCNPGHCIRHLRAVCAGIAIVATMAINPATSAEKLISTLSDSGIEINSSFTGEQIVVFGAITNGDVVVGANDGDAQSEGKIETDYEVAVVVRGPEEEIVARRKDRILGLWVNAASHSFFKVPSYYVAHMSGNLAEGASEELLRQYKLGLDNLNFVRSAYDPADHAFAEALIQIRKDKGLYIENPEAVEFLAPGVFRTTFELPTIIPVGTFRVSVFIFRHEKLVAARTENLLVTKTGISDQIAKFARSNGFIYGLMTVALAIATGWFAGVIFRKD